ncbi:MAG: NAD(P)H-binding protein [Archangium sp.]
MSDTLLITGASGHLGRRVLELLVEQKPKAKIVAVTRTPQKLAEFAKQGIEVRQGSFDDEASMKTAFAGATRALLISTDALDRPRGEQHARGIAALQAAGVKHVIYTSVVDPKNTVMGVGPDHAFTEKALEASTMSFTSLRNSLYADLLLQALPSAVKSGQWITSRGDAKAAFVTREDCARAAAAALTATSTEREYIDITGPEAIDSNAIAAIASELSGKKIAHVSVPVDALIDGLVTHAKLPRPIAAFLATFDQAIGKGELSKPSDGLKRLTGRSAQTIREFLTANRVQWSGGAS